MTTKPQLLSQRAYARHRGVSHTAVRKAIKAGRISTTDDGKIEPERADQQWAANTDQSKTSNAVAGTHQQDQPVIGSVSPIASHPNPSPQVSSGPTTYSQSRGVREIYLARTAKLEFEVKSGKLIDADEVRVAAFNAARSMRNMILGIPDRLAATLAAQKDPRECHLLLTNELRRACDELSRAKLTD